MRSFTNYEVAANVVSMAMANPTGGSVDLHVSNRGQVYAPKNPTYLVGGADLVKPEIVKLSILTAPAEGETLKRVIDRVNGMIEETTTSTVIGWWQHTDSSGEPVVIFDVSDEYDAENHSIQLPLKHAQQRGEVAIGLYVNGTYAHSILVR